MGATVAFLGLCLVSRWRGNKNSLIGFIFRVRRHLKTNIPMVAGSEGYMRGQRRGEKGQPRKIAEFRVRKRLHPDPKSRTCEIASQKNRLFQKPNSEKFGNIRKNSENGQMPKSGFVRKYSELFGVRICEKPCAMFDCNLHKEVYCFPGTKHFGTEPFAAAPIRFIGFINTGSQRGERHSTIS